MQQRDDRAAFERRRLNAHGMQTLHRLRSRPQAERGADELGRRGATHFVRLRRGQRSAKSCQPRCNCREHLPPLAESQHRGPFASGLDLVRGGQGGVVWRGQQPHHAVPQRRRGQGHGYAADWVKGRRRTPSACRSERWYASSGRDARPASPCRCERNGKRAATDGAGVTPSTAVA